MIKDGEVNETEDLPLSECAQKAEDMIAAGGTIYQKFTCGKCGNRLVMDVPNTFYVKGSCDRCGHVTDIKYCGFLLILGIA